MMTMLIQMTKMNDEEQDDKDCYDDDDDECIGYDDGKGIIDDGDGDDAKVATKVFPAD